MIARGLAPYNPTMRVRSTLRVLALLCSGALGVHELRNLVAFGSMSDHSGHHAGSSGVLWSLAPLLSLLLAAGFAGLLLATANGRRERGSWAVRVTRLWPIATSAVLLMYAVQELLQATLGDGHATGLHGAFGHGGWVAVPIAIVVGALVAATFRTVCALERRAGFAGLVRRLSWPALSAPVLPLLRRHVARGVVGRNLAKRGPPLLVG